jgi:hypothetical protein
MPSALNSWIACEGGRERERDGESLQGAERERERVRTSGSPVRDGGRGGEMKRDYRIA